MLSLDSLLKSESEEKITSREPLGEFDFKAFNLQDLVIARLLVVETWAW